MEFQDRILRCVDCGAEFVWTAGEQQFFADKNFKNEPKRCKACKAKRASRPAGADGRARTGGNRDQLLGVRQGNHGAVPSDAGAPGLLQGMLPVPQVRGGWERVASMRLFVGITPRAVASGGRSVVLAAFSARPARRSLRVEARRVC